MDVLMPEMDGITATKHIRQNLTPDQQPYIIAITANATVEDRDRCLSAGMNECIFKPFRVERLISALKQSKEKVLN